MDFTLSLLETPFNIDYTLESGQVFRWEKKNEWWYGVIGRGVVKVKQEEFSLHCVSSNDSINPSFIRSYFRLDDDLKAIHSAIMKDVVMTEAVQRFYGLRLLRQDRWECLVSFVIATNSNIPSIKRMLTNLCEKFGREVSFEGLKFRLFPTQEIIASSSLSGLSKCGLGYRSSFVKNVGRAIYEGKMDLSELAVLDYLDARNMLLRELAGEKVLLGVGPKVSDCTLLFSCDKSEAFPIDIWVARAVAKYYPHLLSSRVLGKLYVKDSEEHALTLKDYDFISSAMRGYFGKYAGYAQQYLFLFARSSLSQ